jgi:hypothetical protein
MCVCFHKLTYEMFVRMGVMMTVHPYNENDEIREKKKFCFDNIKQKIWCASWARVNLPHIGIKRCIKIVLQRNLLKKTHVLSFFSRNLYRRYRWDVKNQNLECLFLFLDPKIVTKSAVKFILPFLVGICMEGTLRMSNFKNLSIFSDS